MSIPHKHCTKGCAHLQASRWSPDRSQQNRGYWPGYTGMQTHEVIGSSKTHFPSKLWRLGKAIKLPRKSKRKSQKISNKVKSNTSLFYKLFLSKDKAYIETYKKYSLGKKKTTENYDVSAALIYLHHWRIALCSVLSVNTNSSLKCNHSYIINVFVNHSFPLLGNVCILVSAPMCFCGSPSHCRCLFLSKFLSSISLAVWLCPPGL